MGLAPGFVFAEPRTAMAIHATGLSDIGMWVDSDLVVGDQIEYSAEFWIDGGEFDVAAGR